MSADFDVIVIGSGFGGSVSALRLAEKGYRVAVLEQGRDLTSADLQRAGSSVRHLLWAPALGMRGPLAQKVFANVGVVHGVGVGGGSLVYAAVLLEPKASFYQAPAWRDLHSDWQRELAPHYQRARQMLGASVNPYVGLQDDWLQQTAAQLGRADSYGPVTQGIYFGAPEVAVDPYFSGKGPLRQGCSRCGNCISGCAQGAKNSLDKNYLHLARQLGVQVISEARVSHLSRKGEHYHVHLQRRGTGAVVLRAMPVQVAEVTVQPSGDIRVDRVVCAVDCGMVVNPDTVQAQVDGSIQFGVTAALWGEITLQGGRVEQSNFHDYRLLRLSEAPRVDVLVLPSTQAPGGIGEPGTSAVIAAVANAVAAATGQRLRSLPLRVG